MADRPGWERLLEWRYEGPRFERPGIELRDLAALHRLRGVLVALARAAWGRRNPSRTRASANAATNLEIRIFEFRPGSCVVQAFYAPPPPATTQLALVGTGLEERDRLELTNALPEAARLLSNALDQLSRGEEVADEFPPEILPDLTDLLGSIEDGATVRVTIPERDWPEEHEKLATAARRISPTPAPIARPPTAGVEEAVEAGRLVRTVKLDAALASRAKEVVKTRQQVQRTVTGEVTMASLKGRASIVVDGRDVKVEFTEEHRAKVTGALHQHDEQRLRVRGAGEVDLRTGRLTSLVVQDLEVLTVLGPDTWSTTTFERWAVDDPGKLLAAIGSGTMGETLLSFALEIAGRHLPTADVVPVLFPYLGHPDPMVREGAIYGLGGHAGDAIDLGLAWLAEVDASPGVRAAAAATLEDR